MLSKLTLVGLYQYSDTHLFDNLALPTGINKQVVVNEILRLGGEFSTVYPDLEFMEYQIDIFSKKWYHNFERWYKVYTEEYEPLYNVDVKTSIEEQGHNQEDSAKAGNASGNTSHNSSGSSNGNNTTTTQKAAFDSGTFQNTEKVIADTSLSSSELGSETTSSTNSESLTAEQYHTILTEEYKRGNQGVTMSQEMLLAEYNAWFQNLYIMIAEVFINEFCVCIYK